MVWLSRFGNPVHHQRATAGKASARKWTSERARENGGLKIDSTPLNNPGTQEHWAVAAQTQRWPSKDGEASLAIGVADVIGTAAAADDQGNAILKEVAK